MKEISMVFSRMAVMSLLAAALVSGAAQAQTQTPAAPPSISAQAERTMTDVSSWTRKQWHAAKARWREEKDAWNSCQNEAKAQSLSGRKNWQFLYDCMTKS
jgi:basic membrane lipoprotein Med (substrate-binding protein (PBP1-ABC) superfamily)